MHSNRRIGWRLAIASTALALVHCSTVNVAGSPMPGVTFADSWSYYVEKFEPDNRGLEETIRDQLDAMGFSATSGPKGEAPSEADVIVTYKDRWMWDMSMYLMQLDIQMNDRSGRVIATGQSYRTSLARKDPEVMAREVLDKIFNPEGA